MTSSPNLPTNDDVDREIASRRIFLGLDQPPLATAAQWLCANFSNDQQNHGQHQSNAAKTLDLEKFIIVLPSTRAKNRLLQLLIAECRDRELLLTPPIITTLGQLPEHLYVAEKQLASELAQQIAWSKAIEQTPFEELKSLTGRAEVEDLRDWQPLANLVSKLHTRLANDIWSFSSVAREIRNRPGFLNEETARWDVLNAIQKRYYKILADVDLWDKQAARNYAAAGLMKAGEIRCATERQIVMLGTADLNRSVSEMIRQIAVTNPQQVHILVAADEAMAKRFNSFGSLITDRWLDTEIELRDEQIVIVDQPADQADVATDYLTKIAEARALGERLATDEITIGIPDPDIVPQLERALNAIGVTYRSLIGRGFAETGPVRLLVACRDFLSRQTFDGYAALVRHPDLFAWLAQQVDNDQWLALLNDFQNESLPSQISLTSKLPFGNPTAIMKQFDPTDTNSKKRARRKAQSAELLNDVFHLIVSLISPLAGDPEPIANWSSRWQQVLVTVYGQRTANKQKRADRQMLKACDAIVAALDSQQQVPSKFNTVTSASQALNWAIEAAAEHRVVDPPIPEAIELAGWLDLPLDDAKVIVVTNMNDEHVPSSEIGHQFLPNELCKQLGILDNDRRFARDVYALTVIKRVREELLLVVGRRDAKGEPKKPSRLLFATAPQIAARRARAFFSFEGSARQDLWIASKEGLAARQQFVIPQPPTVEPLPNLSVTKFRDFIKCPYRFYLNHILKLESKTDDWRELSAGAFGDLCHNVLENFGKSELSDSTDAAQIEAYLDSQLNEMVKRQFVGSRLPSVRIQVEQLRLRLQQFAEAQALWRKKGWRIVSTEEHLFHSFDVDGEPFLINGKIDRVDQHDHTGQIAVWDYKSSDAGENPDRKHYAKRKREWKDLQLPLYRHLVKEVEAVKGGDFDNVLMGYILLPKKLADVGFFEATWTREQLQQADEVAKDVIRQIRAGVYWPPAPKPPLYSGDYAAICQDNVFEQYEIAASFDESDEVEVAPW